MKTLIPSVMQVASLRFQCDSLRVRVGDLETQLRQAQEQRRKRASGGGSLREEEDAFMREERLRDQLDTARKQKMELEAILLEKDSRIIELNFDAEANNVEVARFRRRTHELEAYCRELASGRGGPSTGSAGAKAAWGGPEEAAGTRGPGERFKRERDLEGVVEAMKVVVDKLKAENERLRKGANAATAGGDAALRAKHEADRKKIEKLEEELTALRSKSGKQDESSQKLVQKTQQVASLRKALKQKEDEFSEANRRIEEFDAEREGFRRTIRDAQTRIQQLELQLSTRGGARDGAAGVASAAAEIADLKKKAADSAKQIEELQQKLNDSRRELASAGRRRPADENVDSRQRPTDNETIRRLTSENERLKQELAAFDLEFFEEIENLKYAHAEAVKKLKMYERQEQLNPRR
jgi:DNA repair exonuclease SbcCD ATPase subunit